MMDYPVAIEPLSAEDGGGYVAYAVDLPGCMSDGDTPEEAAANIQDAITEWLDSYREAGRTPPAPFSAYQARRQHTETLLKALTGTIEAFDGLDDRIDALERAVREITEAQENDRRWSHFHVIAGVFSDDDVPLLTQSQPHNG